MVNTGSLTRLTNADRVELTNQTDSQDYGQLTNITWSSEFEQLPKVRTDGTQDSLDKRHNVIIEGDIWLTVPEITTFLGFHSQTALNLPSKNWDLKCTDITGVLDTVRIIGKLSGLKMEGAQKGHARFHVKITDTTGAITEP